MNEYPHAIGELNLERFKAARLENPRLTLAAWIDGLFRAAATARSQHPRSFISTQTENRSILRRRGRPSGVDGRNVTGAIVAPSLARFLLAKPACGATSAEVVGFIEHEYRKSLTEEDKKLTKARIPKWQHAVYSQIAYLRSTGRIHPPDKRNPDRWVLTTLGVTWAKEHANSE